MITGHAVVFYKHGEPKEVLKTHTYKIDDDNLADDSVIVKTLGAPINPSDINQIQGVYPSQPEKTKDLGTEEPSAVAGNEGLFEVVKVGKSVNKLEEGDWVVPSAVNFGTWRTHAVGIEKNFIRLPSPHDTTVIENARPLTVNEGATILVNPPTAYLMLTHYVNLTPGKDWFIQNGGNSAVGVYATQMAKILGINSISVIRNRPNVGQLIDTLINEKGATKVITEEDNESREFGATVKSWVKESGGDIKLALNCVGGKNATAIARKLGKNGLMLTYGGMSMQPVTIPTSLHIFKNFTSSGFWVTELLKNNAELKQKALDQIVKWYQTGQLQVAPSHEIIFTESSPKSLSEFFIDGVNNSKAGKQLITFN